MSFDISDADFKRGKEYMESLRVDVPQGSKSEQKQFVADWIRLNGMSDQEIDDHLSSIKKGATPKVASAPKVDVSPIASVTRPTGNNAFQWKTYVAALVEGKVIPAYTGGGSVAEMKSYIDEQLAKKANLAPDTFTQDEKDQMAA